MPTAIIEAESLKAIADDVHALTPDHAPSPSMQRALRRASGLQIKQLAWVLDVTPDALVKHETGAIAAYSSLATARRARRTYGELYRLLGSDVDLLADAIELGPEPLRGRGAVVRT